MLSVHARCRLFTAAARTFLIVADSSLNEALPFDRATVFTDLGGSLQEVVGDSLYPFVQRVRVGGGQVSYIWSGIEITSVCSDS